MKLFPKLAIWVSLLLTSTILALCTTFYIAEKRSILSQVQMERQSLLQNLVHISREALVSGDDLLLVKYTRWLQRWNPSVVSLSVVNSRGDVLAHSEPNRIGHHDPMQARNEYRNLHKEAVLIQTQTVSIGTKWIATVSAGFSEKHLREDIRTRLSDLRRRLQWIAFSALASGLCVSFGVALSWTRPLQGLMTATEHVGKGRYRLSLEKTACRRDELGILARAFEGMAKDLEHLDQMKDDFVSAVTHELRSPLGAIESYLNLMCEESRTGIPTSGWAGYLERLRINTHRLMRFVNDLLDVAALERGSVDLRTESVAVDRILDELLHFYQPAMREKKIRCSTQFPPVTPLIIGDPDKIRQIFTNLISNALKFTPEQGSLQIGIESHAASDMLCVSIQDSGIGIAPEDQDRIFNKFEQVGTARARVKGPKGTGLGLAICRNLVIAHGGTITVQSAAGKGSRFMVSFPIQRQCIQELL